MRFRLQPGQWIVDLSDDGAGVEHMIELRRTTRRLRPAALALGLLIPMGAAHADVYTGNDLYALCIDPSETSKLFCAGYIAGITEAGTTQGFFSGIEQRVPKSVALTRQEGMLGPITWCFGAAARQMTNRQIADVAIKYLTDHPAERTDPAPALVADALHAAWPCGR